MVQRWYNPEFAEKNWNTIKSGKQAVTKPGESEIQERMMSVLGPLAEKIRRDPEVISYFIAHNPGNWIEYNFRMNSDGSGTKVVDVKYYPPAKPGVAESANPADTLYFFDVERGGRSFDKLDLKIMGLKQSQKGKWYYQPGRDSTDLITNATIKHLEKTLNVPARAWKRPVEEQQLAELKCWSGYTRVPGVPAGAPGSCRKKTNEAEQCPECGGPMFSELMINEKQDACYYKVKSRYKVWPSAYASGALVQCRKKGAANWGNKSK
jgi:hypothetical protein